MRLWRRASLTCREPRERTATEQEIRALIEAALVSITGRVDALTREISNLRRTVALFLDPDDDFAAALLVATVEQYAAAPDPAAQWANPIREKGGSR